MCLSPSLPPPSPVMEVSEGAVDRSLTGSAREPSLTTHYNVRRSDNTWHVGEVIQKRTNTENGLTELYIHYKDCKELHRFFPSSLFFSFVSPSLLHFCLPPSLPLFPLCSFASCPSFLSALSSVPASLPAYIYMNLLLVLHDMAIFIDIGGTNALR